MQQPDNSNLRSTGSGHLPLSTELTPKAQEAYVLPNLKSASLIALGQLCDDGCKVVLTPDRLDVVKNKKIILTGHRNRHDDLWDIPITKTTLSHNNYLAPQTHSSLHLKQNRPTGKNLASAPSQKITKANGTTCTRRRLSRAVRSVNDITIRECTHHITRQLHNDTHNMTSALTQLHKQHKMGIIIRKKQTHHDLIRYLHAACFAPVPSTWKRAIKNNNFVTWPGLTVDLINRHLPPSIATVRGHVHRERKHLQSSKSATLKSDKNAHTIAKPEDDPTGDDDDFFPPPPAPNVKTNQVAYVLIDRKEISTAYHDLTGRFPIRSSQGNEYVMIGYHFDANYILGHPVRDRTASAIKKAWEHMHHEFSKAGAAPSTWVLDNEVSAELKQAFAKQNVSYQLVPPRSHRRNLAERAIQTWKTTLRQALRRPIRTSQSRSGID